MSDSLRPHEPEHVRSPCPSPTPGVHPNSCPLSQWCHPTISSSVVPFSCPQSFPASGSFQMSQLFASGGQSIGVSASASVLPMNIQDWFPLGWTGWISLQSKGLSRVFSNTTFKSINSSALSFLYSPTLTSIHATYLSAQFLWDIRVVICTGHRSTPPITNKLFLYLLTAALYDPSECKGFIKKHWWISGKKGIKNACI